MGLKFQWSLYFFFPPIILADAVGWLVIPLAIAVAAIWWRLGGRMLDAAVLGLALVGAIAVVGLVLGESTWQTDSLGTVLKLVSIAAANFVWFAAILLPVRWLAHRFLGA